MSFDIALSGIQAINSQLTTISNNIANSGTFGFKSSRANFSSMYAGTQPTGTEIGSITQSIALGGGVLNTGGSMDASIKGRGFFVSKDSAGTILYSRVGIFNTDKDGYVTDSFGRRAQGYAAVPGTTTLGALGDLRVPTGQIPASASTKMDYVGNLSADWTVPTTVPFDPTDATSFNSSVVTEVFDSLGGKHSVTQYYVKTGANAVDVRYTFDGAVQPTTTALSFDLFGRLNPPGPVTLALAPVGAAAMSVGVNYAGTTQFAGEATSTTNAANGYAAGALTGVQISEDGAVMATYSNSEKQSIGTLALATFANEGALESVSDTSWVSTNASGNALYSTPGRGMTGTLTVGALEQSNVDITSELVSLMTSQRNYQANSKVISTENAMMQSLMQAL
ncbi:MAG TPA: flagellar hook-basal body complex protein [Burkholderiaceae bacterium]|nr:flagellar hook-basal body complex protein [Burkholderiaceae bacterium]